MQLVLELVKIENGITNLKQTIGERYMRKRITVVLEVDTEDEQMQTDDFIKEDLEREINCASNLYDIKSIEIEELT